MARQRFTDHRDIFFKVCSVAHVRPDAPPFLVAHGSADRIIPVAQAQAFVVELRAVSQAMVGYLELPGADHGFDLIDRSRAGPTKTVIGLFFNEIHRKHQLSTARQAI